MGITIHFEGKVKNDENYNLLVRKVIEYSEFQGWNFFEFQNELKKLERVKNEEDWDYIGTTKGVQVQPHKNSEPLIFEFDKDLYIQEYCKTQFSDIETHIKITELLNVITDYFSNLEIFDESEYWETGNERLLQENWEKFYTAMDEAMAENSYLKGPFKLENGRIIDLM
ncbi:hypothetical protein [Chryseobacterium sp. Leaf394]|uniref:hypothetical protein n=1 Tax=Chryseobacterium sp. Leaf394 TaxID=1736361 RepID=UPI0006F296B0|nr:hypothetical protein [Chryseobacterium sp. Leaf394]KQS89793.1 hypothetical protein ASG21_15060 [Chryseobacterium sp. Leaf394]